ncbi:MAG: UbiA family prenyltransferase [candidate division KSB1 bacterium]|nr:UbiA family prenyltransferase [candidate division KSB1 bacterium]
MARQASPWGASDRRIFCIATHNIANGIRVGNTYLARASLFRRLQFTAMGPIFVALQGRRRDYDLRNQGEIGDMELDEKISSILNATDRLFLSTAVDGNPSGSALFFARDGNDLIFFTFSTTRKAEQIRYNPRVQAVIWPRGEEGIRGLQIEGECHRIRDPQEIERTRQLLLGVTTAFQAYMDDPFLRKNGVVGFYRLRPTLIKYVDFYAPEQMQWREYPENQPGDLQLFWRAFKNRIALWVRAVRAPFFTGTLVPVVLGAVIARGDLAARGASLLWSWPTFFLTLFGAILAHAGTNLANDYFDHTSRNDEYNRYFSPFNGGSRMIQAGLLPAWKVLFAALLCFALTAGIGLYLNRQITGSVFGNSPLLWIGAAGIALGLLYTGSPVRLGYRGFGELAIALGFGPIMVLGSHYVLFSPAIRQSGAGWPWVTPLLASVPVAILIMLVVWINQFQDLPADRKVGKNNWVVRLGTVEGGTVRYEKPFRYYAGFLYATFGYILILSLLGLADRSLSSPWAWIALLPAFLVAKMIRWGKDWLRRWQDPQSDRHRLPYELLRVNASTIAVHLVTGLLLALGFWLGYGG